MIKETLEQIAIDNGWGFHYGRRDFHNLFDAIGADDPKWYLFLDPIIHDDGKAEWKGTVRYMLLQKSMLDELYEPRYTKYIKPKIDFVKTEFKNKLICSDIEVNSHNITEVINLLDANMDGILGTLKVTDYDY